MLAGVVGSGLFLVRSGLVELVEFVSHPVPALLDGVGCAVHRFFQILMEFLLLRYSPVLWSASLTDCSTDFAESCAFRERSSSPKAAFWAPGKSSKTISPVRRAEPGFALIGPSFPEVFHPGGFSFSSGLSATLQPPPPDRVFRRAVWKRKDGCPSLSGMYDNSCPASRTRPVWVTGLLVRCPSNTWKNQRDRLPEKLPGCRSLLFVVVFIPPIPKGHPCFFRG